MKIGSSAQIRDINVFKCKPGSRIIEILKKWVTHSVRL